MESMRGGAWQVTDAQEGMVTYHQDKLVSTCSARKARTPWELPA